MIISRELDALITAEHKAGYYATVQQLGEMRHWQDERKAIKEKIACAFDELRERADEAEHQRDELLAACKAIRAACKSDKFVKIEGDLIGSIIFGEAAEQVDKAIASVEKEK